MGRGVEFTEHVLHAGNFPTEFDSDRTVAGVSFRWIGLSQTDATGVTKASRTVAHDPSNRNLIPVNAFMTPEPTESPSCSDYLLVCQANSVQINYGSWHFTLESCDGELVLEAGDDEAGDLNRLTLLATVRGLESIEGASRVTLLSTNRYLIRSLTDSLPRWRENQFVWEHFGRRIDVQHADLWRRVDRALSIHRVEACLVSSRLVSRPEVNVAGRRLGEGPDAIEVRMDSGHGPTPRGPSVQGPASQRPASQAPATRGPTRAATPKDQLRRWLLGTATSADAGTVRRRFNAADLMEA